jgi:hypothetical protein
MGGVILKNLFSIGILTFTWLSGLESVISGREGAPIYRIEASEGWEQEALQPQKDTREPIAAWRKEGVRLVLHNFPNTPIPPEAQVERWKRQAPADIIEAQAFSGYAGLKYENDQTLAWALSWRATPPEENESYSDITFKATGPIEPFRDEIIEMVRSFERIEAPELW